MHVRQERRKCDKMVGDATFLSVSEDLKRRFFDIKGLAGYSENEKECGNMMICGENRHGAGTAENNAVKWGDGDHPRFAGCEK